MRKLLLLSATLFIGCAPDLRGATVQVGNNVNMDAAIEAVDKLNKVTNNDTNLEIGICAEGDCIRLNYENVEVRANAKTGRIPPWEHTVDISIYPKGNSASVIAHELLHAIGIREHLEAPYADEIDVMNDAAWGWMPARFGNGSAALYNDHFGTEVKPDSNYEFVFSGQ